jgi:hypothetical protein
MLRRALSTTLVQKVEPMHCIYQRSTGYPTRQKAAHKCVGVNIRRSSMP